MADETVTHVALNRMGDMTEDYGYFTASGTTVDFMTKVRNVKLISMLNPGVASPDNIFKTYLNTNGTTEDTVGQFGRVHCVGVKNGNTYYYRAVGRGG